MWKITTSVLLALLVQHHGAVGQEQQQPLSPLGTFPPTCDGCFCVPGEGESCPAELPPSNFNFTEQLKAMRWKNPIQLKCNPYPYAQETARSSVPCTLTDRAGNNVEEDLGDDAVCAVQVDQDNIRANKCYKSYTTKSFESRQAAEAAGYVVTHTGTCGTCSSLQDLAIYIETPDLQSAGWACAFLALSNETAALECYKEVGFSDYCAASWLYDTTNTRENCLDICLPFHQKPPNLNVSGCPLNDCILCNEEISGPYFKQYAGRTRRGSGLLSYIIRNCSELVGDVVPLDPCPNGYIPGLDDVDEDDDFLLLEEEGTSLQSAATGSRWISSVVPLLFSSLIISLAAGTAL